METKYYTPDISDLFVGYEFEEYNPMWDDNYTKDEGNWLNQKLQSGRHLDHVSNKIYLKQIRTPYLSKEQIEAEEWVYNKEYDVFHKEIDSESGYSLKIYNSGKIEISDTGEVIYSGKCSSINEFRKITKWLGI